MKKAFHKALSFTMALVVLFSTMSFTISSHYCGDSLVDTSIFLVDTSIFHKVKSCGMESETQAIRSLKSSDCSIIKKNCCSEENQIIKGQDELQLSFEKISFDQQIFVASFVYSYTTLFEGFENKVSSYTQYPPPLIVRHLYKLDETYLI